MGIKIILIFFIDVLFPLLQPGQGGGPKAPITEGIILLVTAALGIGMKTFSKKNKE